MMLSLHTCRRFFACTASSLALILFASALAAAATTGSISGTITDASTKKPLARAAVVVASPAGRATAATDDNGFFNIANLAPDTYTVSLSAAGHEDVVLTGVTVVQDQDVRINPVLGPRLVTIGRTSARSASNLVQSTQTADVYNVSAQQLGAAAGVGGHRSLYDVIQTSPGVTSTGFAGRPRIRGSDVGDVSWEYDGIPINDRLTGLFTTNLSIVGTRNLEVYTGGFNASYGNAAAGVINSVVKRGTFPSSGAFRYTTQLGGLTEHDVQAEYGSATRDGKLSWYASLDWVNSDNQFASGQFPKFSQFYANTGFSGDPGTINSRDGVINLHYKPRPNDDIQFLWQTGNQRIPWDKALPSTAVGVAPCHGVVVTPGTLVVTNPGVSDTGLPCIAPGAKAGSAPVPTGLQYIGLNANNANVWYHFSNLLKLQWNHVFSEKLFGQFRLAENFNQYIFDQPYDQSNPTGAIKPGDPFNIAKSPGNQDEYSDRRSHIYLGQFDLRYTANANSVVYGGLAYERDHSHEQYVDMCGCDDAATGSPYNKDGSFPNLFLNIDYPLMLPSAYLGTKQTYGKLTIEPSVRYDGETYQIPNRPDTVDAVTGKTVKSYAYGPYRVHAWSPRFAFAWATDSSSSIRGSYGTTTTFVPAAYVFNNSPNGITDQDGRAISPYFPGAQTAPQRNFNADLAYSHALRNNIDSFRIAPFYRHAVDKLELTKPFTLDPVTGLPKFSGTSFFRTGIQNRATGVEMGWNHQLPGEGFSWYLSGTYINYWGSVTDATLAGGTPYGNISSNSSNLRAFLTTNALYRNPAQPPWNLAFTGDYTKGRYRLQPYFVYQVGAPYNVFGNTTYTDPATGTKTVDRAVHYARGFFFGNLDAAYDLSKDGKRTNSIGLNIRNLFDTSYGDVAPVVNGQYPKGPDTSTYGRLVPNTLYYYAPDAQKRLFQLYFSAKI